MTSEGKWKGLQDSILSAADKILGHRKRRHVDWFAEKTELLEGPIKEVQ